MITFFLLVVLIADVCRDCGHVIAVHQYTFSVDEDYQVQLSDIESPYYILFMQANPCVFFFFYENFPL